MTTQTLVHSIDLGGEPDSRLGLGFRGYIGDRLGPYRDHGKDNGNHYNRAWTSGVQGREVY